MLVVGDTYMYLTAGTRMLWMDGNTYIARYTTDSENACDKCCFRHSPEICDTMEQRYKLRCDLRAYLVKEKDREEENIKKADAQAQRTHRSYKQAHSNTRRGFSDNEGGSFADRDDRIAWQQAQSMYDSRT